MTGLRVALDELVGVKQAARSLPRLVDQVSDGQLAHVILTRRGKPAGVLLSLARYEQLIAPLQKSV